MLLHRFLYLWFVAVCFAVAGLVSNGLAQRLVTPSAPPSADASSVGRAIVSRNTLQFTNRNTLIFNVAGRISAKAFERYTLPQYLQLTTTGKAGKVFEAVVAFEENQRLGGIGSRTRLLVTAAEGRPHHPADLIFTGGTREIPVQLKLGWKAGVTAVTDPKYSGMKILLPRDQMEVILRELAKRKQAAGSRGVPLPATWRNLDDAVQSGRVTARLSSGLQTPTRKEIYEITRQHTSAGWQRLERTVRAGNRKVETGARVASRSAGPLSITSSGGKTAGSVARRLPIRPSSFGPWVRGGFLGAHIAMSGYHTYWDVKRYRAGEIGRAHLGMKGTNRGLQTGFLGYLLFAPDPTTLTKVVAVGGLVLLTVADGVSDYIHDNRQKQTRRLLEVIDREERFHAARRQLRNSVEFSGRGHSEPVVPVGPSTVP